jgi:hypothetical protein
MVTAGFGRASSYDNFSRYVSFCAAYSVFKTMARCWDAKIKDSSVCAKDDAERTRPMLITEKLGAYTIAALVGPGITPLHVYSDLITLEKLGRGLARRYPYPRICGGTYTSSMEPALKSLLSDN